MPLQVVRQDITKMQVDAIVNAANCDACVGEGVDLAIYRAAGYETLLRERRKIGAIKPGDCVPTSGLGLDCRYILHTVGSYWEGGAKGEEELLRCCYRNSLRMAVKLRCRSIALPLMASGTFGYPKELALRVAKEELLTFLEKHDLEIYIVLYDKEATLISRSLFDKVTEYIDNHYVQQHGRAAGRAMPGSPKPSLEEVLAKPGETFSQQVLRLMKEKQMKPAEVYKGANMDRKAFSKIKTNPHIHPSKLTALSIVVGLRLNVEEAQRLLATAGYSLSESSDMDLIIRYFLQRGQYNWYDINCVLYEKGQPCLGQN